MDGPIIAAWFTGVVGGAMASLALAQLITGRPRYPLMWSKSDWSRSELRVLALAWSITWLALTIYGLFGALSMSAGRFVPLGEWYGIPIAGLALYLIVIGATVTQAMLEQRHKGRWPFRRGFTDG